MSKELFFTCILLLILVLGLGGEETKIFQLTEVSRSQIPKDVFLPGLGSINFDNQGNVYAYAGKYNFKECFVVKLDPNLKFLKQLGKYGRGPGEFTTDFSTVDGRITLDNTGTMYVINFNPQKLTVFDKDGTFYKDINVQRDYPKLLARVYGIKMLTPSIFVGRRGSIMKSMNEKPKPSTGILASFASKAVILNYPFIEEQIFVKTGKTMTIGVKSPYFGDNCFIETDGEHIIFGNSQIYRFHLYNRQGKLIFKVDDPSRKMSSFQDSESKELVKLLFPPPSKIKERHPKHFYDVIRDVTKRKNVIADIKLAGNKIFVFLVPADISNNPMIPVNIFNMEGEIIKKGFFRKIPQAIYQKYAYDILRNEADDPVIVKYKIAL